MRTFNEYITELFDNPFKFKKVFSDKEESRYSFNGGKKQVISVNFESVDIIIDDASDGPGEDKLVRVFIMAFNDNSAAPGSFSLSGAGNEFRVFATIYQILLDVMKKQKPVVLGFSADKGDSTNRAKLYSTFTKKIKISGYKKMTKENSVEKYFFLYNSKNIIKSEVRDIVDQFI